MGRKKVTVIGAGNVGATCAQRIVEANVADVVLVDVVEGLAQGKALDMMQSAPVVGFEATIVGTQDYAATEGSAVIVVTAGIARKPGMSRDDLFKTNAAIIKDVVGKAAPLSPNAVIVVVTNPLDAMTYIAQQASGFPAQRVIGMAGELDGARFAHCVRERVSGAKAHTIKTMVLGTHGDEMVPLVRFSMVNGKKVKSLLSAEDIATVVEKTKKGGAEIVSLLKTGSAYYAPSAATFRMVKSIVNNENAVLCCSVFVQGEYGIFDTYCGLPVKLGAQGVTEIIELELTDEEQSALMQSSNVIKESIHSVKAL